AEAMGHAQQALAWLEEMDLDRDRAIQELHVQSVLITALIALKGAGAAEVETCINRARELVTEVGDSPYTIQTLAQLGLYYQMRARLADAIAVGEQCRALAERAGHTGAQITALNLLAQNLVYTARYEEARAVALRALALYDPDEHMSYS